MSGFSGRLRSRLAKMVSTRSASGIGLPISVAIATHAPLIIRVTILPHPAALPRRWGASSKPISTAVARVPASVKGSTRGRGQLGDGVEQHGGFFEEHAAAPLHAWIGSHIGQAEQALRYRAVGDAAGFDQFGRGSGMMRFGVADDVDDVRLELHLQAHRRRQVAARHARVGRIGRKAAARLAPDAEVVDSAATSTNSSLANILPRSMIGEVLGGLLNINCCT